jgi:methenyltetrahydromethanopterin cyclohydrolase
MPSSASRDYGKPFAEIFQAFRGNFYDIDPLLFSPARVTVTALESGNSIEAGVLDEALLDRSFGEVG